MIDTKHICDGCRLGNMIACFRYAPANVYSVNLPPSMLEFNYSEHEDWLQKEVKEVFFFDCFYIEGLTLFLFLPMILRGYFYV